MFNKRLILALSILLIMSAIITLTFAKVTYAQVSDRNPFSTLDKARDESLRIAKGEVNSQISLKSVLTLDEKKQKEKDLLAASGKRYIVKFKENASMQQIFEIVNGYNYQLIGNSERRMFVLKLNNLQDFEQRVTGLIEFIEEDKKKKSHVIPSDQYYSDQWALPVMNMPKAWDVTKGSNSIYVAVIDSGIYRNQPDLAGADIRNGWDYIFNEPCDWDSFGHGTNVTGIIGAKTNNAKGIAGINWNVAIIPLRVIYSDGTVYTSGEIQAIYDAADAGCDVINLSLGGSYYSSAENSAVSYAISKGSIVVASAGNGGTSSYSYPASYSGVISVGSIDSDLTYSYFSQFNDKVDVSAPGSEILTTAYWIDNDGYDYKYVSGTSLSAPQVAGIAALAKACDPSLTPTKFEDLIKTTSTDLGPPGYDTHYGYGLINAEKMLKTIVSPAVPRGFHIESESDKQITVKWTANSEPNLGGYQLEYKLPTATSWSIASSSLAPTVTTYTKTGLVNGTTYEFRLKAKNTAGNWSGYSEVISGVPVDNIAPPTPTGLKVSSVNDHQVSLSWIAVSSKDLAGYQIEYKKISDVTWAEAEVGKVITYTITGLTNGEEYGFRIKAKDTSGNLSAASVAVTGTPTKQVKSVSIIPNSLSLEAGASSEIKLNATFVDGTFGDVTGGATWKSSNEKVATVKVIDGKETVTAVAKGTATITGTLGGKTATISVKVTLPVTGLQAQPENVALLIGKSQKMKIYVLYNDGTKEDVTKLIQWNSDNDRIATADKGIIKGISKGETTVTAKYSDAVQIAIPVKVTPTLKSLTVRPATVNMVIGDILPITVQANYSDGSTEDVTTTSVFKVSNSKLATISKDDDTVTINAIAKGTAAITASFNGKSATTKLKVTPPVTGLQAQPENVALLIGKSQKMKTYVLYNDGSKEDVTKLVTFTSADNNVASVSNGSVKGVSKGETTVTAKYSDSVHIDIPVKVTAALKSLTANPSALTLGARDSGEITLQANYVDNSTEDISALATWKSSNIKVATISLVEGKVVVNAIAKGTATLTGTFGGKTVKIKLTIIDVNYKPTVTITTIDGVASETGMDQGLLTVTRTGSINDALIVSYTIAGTAIEGADFDNLPGWTIIPAGQTSESISITAINDSELENTETVVVTLVPSNSYNVGTPGSATINLLDDDQQIASYGVVTGFTTVNGDDAVKLLLADGTKKTIVSNGADVTSVVYGHANVLTKGDFIRYEQNADSEIDTVTVLAAPNAAADTDDDYTQLNIESLSTGTVYDCSSTSIKVGDKRYTVNASTKYFEIYNIDKLCTVSSVDKGATVVIIDTDDDNKSADYVVVITE